MSESVAKDSLFSQISYILKRTTKNLSSATETNKTFGTNASRTKSDCVKFNSETALLQEVDVAVYKRRFWILSLFIYIFGTNVSIKIQK